VSPSPNADWPAVGRCLLLTGDPGSEMIRNDRKCRIHGAGHYEENLKVPLVVKLP
jgi:hypothetical protein